MEQHTGSVSSHLHVDIVTVRITYGTNISLHKHTHTHTSYELVSIRYDGTFYEECVSVIIYVILLFYVILCSTF
jgi:hypothetical protein